MFFTARFCRGSHAKKVQEKGFSSAFSVPCSAIREDRNVKPLRLRKALAALPAPVRRELIQGELDCCQQRAIETTQRIFYCYSSPLTTHTPLIKGVEFHPLN